MRRLIMGVAVVAILAVVLAVGGAVNRINSALNKANAEADRQTESIQTKVERKNPWTNLKVNNRPKNFQFAILTDRTGGRRPGVFTQAIEKINLLQPEFVVSVGDLIEGYTEDPGGWALEWSEFQTTLERLQMPFFMCAGNHDISNLPMSDEWKRKFGRTYYHFKYHDVLFLVLNTEEKPAPMKKPPYYIGPEQRRWAAGVLEANKDVRWTIVILHKPAWYYTGIDHVSHGWKAIQTALGKRDYTVFAGHNHRYGRYVVNGREHYILATTGGASRLDRGFGEGYFDHFVWVTMKDDGPVLANLLLSGVYDKNIRNPPLPKPKKKARKRKAKKSGG